MTLTRRHLRVPALAMIGLLVTIFFLFPYLVGVLTAFKPDHELFSIPPRLFPRHWDLSNFVNFWKVQPIARNLEVTGIVSVCSTVISVLAALPAAYYTARHHFRGRRAYLNLVIMTQMFSPVALIIGL